MLWKNSTLSCSQRILLQRTLQRLCLYLLNNAIQVINSGSFTKHASILQTAPPSIHKLDIQWNDSSIFLLTNSNTSIKCTHFQGWASVVKNCSQCYLQQFFIYVHLVCGILLSHLFWWHLQKIKLAWWKRTLSFISGFGQAQCLTPTGLQIMMNLDYNRRSFTSSVYVLWVKGKQQRNPILQN